MLFLKKPINKKYMRVELINSKGYLRLDYDSKYASGSIPVNNPNELVKAIEEVCGKGSYCYYYKNPNHPFGYTDRAVQWELEHKYKHLPSITYWQQGVKTQVIEQAREVAKQVWGGIPEMRIGWLENMCKTYVDDIESQ
jgi:hypothetical protein